jgi:hypothetical protein
MPTTFGIPGRPDTSISDNGVGDLAMWFQERGLRDENEADREFGDKIFDASARADGSQGHQGHIQLSRGGRTLLLGLFDEHPDEVEGSSELRHLREVLVKSIQAG